MAESRPPADPVLDIRVRWRAGRVLSRPRRAADPRRPRPAAGAVVARVAEGDGRASPRPRRHGLRPPREPARAEAPGDARSPRVPGAVRGRPRPGDRGAGLPGVAADDPARGRRCPWPRGSRWRSASRGRRRCSPWPTPFGPLLPPLPPGGAPPFDAQARPRRGARLLRPRLRRESRARRREAAAQRDARRAGPARARDRAAGRRARPAPRRRRRARPRPCGRSPARAGARGSSTGRASSTRRCSGSWTWPTSRWARTPSSTSTSTGSASRRTCG